MNVGGSSRTYRVAGGNEAGALDVLRSHNHCLDEPETIVHSRFHDSFDWSLFGAGAALEERWTDPELGRELHWTDRRDSGRSTALQQAVSAAPGFADELPPGPVQARVAPVLGIRRLLPVIELTTRIQTLRLLNEDDKTVVRVQVAQPRFRDPASGAEGDLDSRLELLPVRGYDDEFARAIALIKEELDGTAGDRHLLLEALAAAGRQPGGYSSKLDIRLHPKERADVATKQILRNLLDALEANVSGTKANLDTEFLHDLRVATRRTRSALTQIKDVFPQSVVEDFKARFAWLQQVTGPVRDLDVYLLDFPQLQQQLPPPMRPDLEALKTFLMSHYDEEHRRLVAALESPEFAALLRDWRAFIEAPQAREPAASSAALPIKAVADARTRRMLKRVLKEGRAITDASPAEDLHELRKTCKKLRYLMEFFQSLYPRSEIRELIKQTKVLLDNLGDFQDLAVQAEHLERTAVQMQSEGMASVDALLSMGALVNTLFERQAQARTEFARIFAGFDTAETRARASTLFGGGKGSKAVRARGVTA